MEIPSTETAYNCNSFCIWILIGNTYKNMRFAIDYPNTETAHDCRQNPYLDFSL